MVRNIDAAVFAGVAVFIGIAVFAGIAVIAGIAVFVCLQRLNVIISAYNAWTSHEGQLFRCSRTPNSARMPKFLLLPSVYNCSVVCYLPGLGPQN